MPPRARPRIADRSETGRFTPNPLGGAEARSDGSVVLVQRGFDVIGPLAVAASRHALRVNPHTSPLVAP